MVDYYSILMRAVTAREAGDAQWRRGVYDRARQMLVSQLRARHPAATAAAVRAEQSALDGAIERIEAELSQAEGGAIVDDEQYDVRRDGFFEQSRIEAERPSVRPLRLTPASWIVLAVVAAALGAAGYVFWPRTAARPIATKTEAPRSAGAPQAARAPEPATGKDGDLAPGIDGGSTDADLPYFFRRQTTFYRTTDPVGTIIIDKLQRFLYLIQPNNVAVRYGIGLGEQCEDLAGLRRIASKAEWPAWEPPPEMIKRRLAKPGTLPGGPGNPLGARVLGLDDNNSRINGTNAPKTIGTSVIFGCIRLVNDDVVDLYNRVPEGTRVIVQ